MKRTDWTAHSDDRVDDLRKVDGNKYTYSAMRVLVGHCADCTLPLVVFNDHESWPLVACPCGWEGDTQSLVDAKRYEWGIEPAPACDEEVR